MLRASALTDFYRQRAAAPKDAAPAQFHILQRFGSSVNLHLHDHAVVSDGKAAEFVGRMAALVPPARKHVVRYYGALGPRSPLRSAVTEATRGMATQRELESTI